MKTSDTSVVDRLSKVLLLYAIDGTSPVYGLTKVQKTIFILECVLKRDHGTTGLKFPFIRWTNGPFSQSLWSAIDELDIDGLIYPETLKITERGQFLLELVIPEIRAANQNIMKSIDAVVKWCKPKTGSQLMNVLYEKEIHPDENPRLLLKIKDMPMSMRIVIPDENGIALSPELDALIKEELELSGEDLQAATTRLPEIESVAFENLAAALAKQS